MSLVDFLLARFAEDEAVARAAVPGPWGFGGSGVGTSYWDGREEYVIAKTDWTAENGLTREWLDRNLHNGRHIARHDPTRVLADVEAKRQIVADYLHLLTVPGGSLAAHGEWVCRVLARPYAGHPDYDPTWREAS